MKSEKACASIGGLFDWDVTSPISPTENPSPSKERPALPPPNSKQSPRRPQLQKHTLQGQSSSLQTEAAASQMAHQHPYGKFQQQHKFSNGMLLL